MIFFLCFCCYSSLVDAQFLFLDVRSSWSLSREWSEFCPNVSFSTHFYQRLVLLWNTLFRVCPCQFQWAMLIVWGTIRLYPNPSIIAATKHNTLKSGGICFHTCSGSTPSNVLEYKNYLLGFESYCPGSSGSCVFMEMHIHYQTFYIWLGRNSWQDRFKTFSTCLLGIICILFFFKEYFLKLIILLFVHFAFHTTFLEGTNLRHPSPLEAYSCSFLFHLC